jgi:hypothetical protein
MTRRDPYNIHYISPVGKVPRHTRRNCSWQSTTMVLHKAGVTGTLPVYLI